MEQVIFGGYSRSVLPLDTIATEYNILCGGRDWGGVVTGRSQVVSTSGKIKNLRIKLDGSPGAGASYVFTLIYDGAPSALTVTISDAETSGADTEHEIDVVAGKTVTLECNPSDETAPTARVATWTFMFEGGTEKESLILGGQGAKSKSDTRFSFVMGNDGSDAIENNHRQVCPTAGVIKNLYVVLDIDPGTAPDDAYRFTLRVNGANSDDGEGNPLQVTITADDTTGNDTTHEITVAAGDVLTMMTEPLESPSANPMPVWGMTFVADTDGESLVLGGSKNDLDPGATEYSSINVNGAQWLANESDWYQLGQSCTLKKLYMLLSAAPGDGKSYTFTLRKPGNGQADGNLTVTITGAAVTTGNDLVNTDVIADDDYVDLKCVPDGTPTVADAYWGVVCFIEPPAVGLENKSANMGSKMVAAGLI